MEQSGPTPSHVQTQPGCSPTPCAKRGWKAARSVIAVVPSERARAHSETLSPRCHRASPRQLKPGLLSDEGNTAIAGLPMPGGLWLVTSPARSPAGPSLARGPGWGRQEVSSQQSRTPPPGADLREVQVGDGNEGDRDATTKTHILDRRWNAAGGAPSSSPCSEALERSGPTPNRVQTRLGRSPDPCAKQCWQAVDQNLRNS